MGALALLLGGQPDPSRSVREEAGVNHCRAGRMLPDRPAQQAAALCEDGTLQAEPCSPAAAATAAPSCPPDAQMCLCWCGRGDTCRDNTTGRNDELRPGGLAVTIGLCRVCFSVLWKGWRAGAGGTSAAVCRQV